MPPTGFRKTYKGIYRRYVRITYRQRKRACDRQRRLSERRKLHLPHPAEDRNTPVFELPGASHTQFLDGGPVGRGRVLAPWRTRGCRVPFDRGGVKATRSENLLEPLQQGFVPVRVLAKSLDRRHQFLLIGGLKDGLPSMSILSMVYVPVRRTLHPPYAALCSVRSQGTASDEAPACKNESHFFLACHGCTWYTSPKVPTSQCRLQHANITLYTDANISLFWLCIGVPRCTCSFPHFPSRHPGEIAIFYRRRGAQTNIFPFTPRYLIGAPPLAPENPLPPSTAKCTSVYQNYL